MKKRNYIAFVILVILLSFISFYYAFSFTFIVDDWYQLWGVFYDRSIIDYYILTQHPNSAYEFLALAPIFKFNPFYYQIVGFILKIIASLSAALFVFSISRSKKIAAFAGLIFASSVIGIEAFTRISAHNSALLIPTLCLGIYFWVMAGEGKSIYKYFLAIFFIILTIIGDPGLGIMILPILFVWNLLGLYQNFSRQELRKFLAVNPLLLIIPISLKFYLDPRIANRPIADHTSFVLSHISYTLNNFLTSIGNLVIGWVIPLKEDMGLATTNPVSTIFGYSFLLYTIFLGYKFFRKKSENLKILLFLSIWIFLFYFPSWFTQGHYVKGGTISAVSNRYLAISSVGFIIMLAYLLKFLKNRYSYTVLIIIIVFNLISSPRILSAEYKYRSVEIQNKLYGRIDQEFPMGNEKDNLIIFLGENQLKIFGLEWNGFYPLAIKRGITDKKELPTIANSLSEVEGVVCINNDVLPPKFRLSNIYAWKVQNDNIYNISEDVRKFISSDEKCKFIF